MNSKFAAIFTYFLDNLRQGEKKQGSISDNTDQMKR